MEQRPRDEEREERIHMEIVVDAYGPEEQAIGWYVYLDENLQFPFLARCSAERAISPLRPGDEVEVVGMAPEEECAHEMFVLTPWERRTLAVPLTCRRWGAYWLGDVHLRAHDRLRLFTWERHLEGEAGLKVFPVPDALRALVRPFETQVSTGSHVAAQRGDGIEFADLRPFLPGDRPRSVNWRATARRGALMVNQRHPERATDVVLFLDSFLDVRGPAGSTLDRTVGAAASLAAAYLRQRDRVGLVSFGGFVQWLQPGSGQAALYRLLDTLMETQVFATAAWKGIRHLPPRTLPAKALIVALTPLVDERGVAALFDLLARGYDLAVVDISPLIPAGSGGGEWGELASRLWALERETLRHRYQRLGAAVVEWTEAAHLQQVLLEVEACRRRAGLAPG